MEESKRVFEKAKGDKNVHQKIRLIVNIITPDNFEKKFEELRQYLFGDIKCANEEGYDPAKDKLVIEECAGNLEIVVERIFIKAQNEKEYCVFYGELCEKIIKLELALKGEKATVKNSKKSEFRQQLLKHCRSSFDQFFTQEAKEIISHNDHEAILKFQQKLFNNINFVGELNRRTLIQESIILSVFEMLLSVDIEEQLQFVNDETVEGAVILINKIGHLIDAKRDQIESMKGTDKPPREADLVTLTKINKTFGRFESLTEEKTTPPISNRIKMLIKNMLDNRASGWERTKKQNELGPMKVEDLPRETERMYREEQELRAQAEAEEQSYLHGQGGRGRGSGKGGAPVY